MLERDCVPNENAQNTNTFYLVGLPTGRVLQLATRLQHRIAHEQELYDPPYPSLHITVSVFSTHHNDEFRRANRLIECITQNVPPIEIQVTGAQCFHEPKRSLNLAVEENRELRKLAGEINDALNHHSIEAEDMSTWDFHITLINSRYTKREWCRSEFEAACRLMEQENLYATCHIHHLELWSPEFPPLKVLNTFPLQGRR